MAPDLAPGLIARAVAGSGSGIAIADATITGFPLSYVNPAFEALTGYPSAECLGRSCSFLQGNDTDQTAVAELRAALGAGREIRTVLLNNMRDGTPFYNELRLSTVRDLSGRVVQVVGVQHDVSEMVVARRTLEGDRDRTHAELDVLQQALTPAAVTERPHLELATTFIPAEAGVAGDFFLVAPGPGDTTVLVVGDAMGHGVRAAQQATYVRAAFANFARFTSDPLRLLDLANQAVLEQAGGTREFVTAVCACFDPGAGTLFWASAGHPVPLALSDGEPIGPVEHTGISLGIELELHARLNTHTLGPGDGVLMFTDGLPDARSSDRRRPSTPRLGGERVRQLVSQARDQTPRALVDGLHAAASAHSEGHLSDDLCLLAARAQRRRAPVSWLTGRAR